MGKRNGCLCSEGLTHSLDTANIIEEIIVSVLHISCYGQLLLLQAGQTKSLSSMLESLAYQNSS